MKYFIRAIFILFAVLILSFIFFYFWAGSPFYPKSEYYKVSEFDNKIKIPGDTFSIMTYNIGYLSGIDNNLPTITPFDTTYVHLKKAIQVLKTINPDFIGFQEIDFYSHRSHYMNQFDSIGRSAGFYNGAMAVNWDRKYVPFPYWPPSVQFGKLLSGQAILSKYKILDNTVIILPKPDSNPFYYNKFYLDRLIQTASVKIPGGKPLLIVNVHFEAFDKNTRENDSGILIQYLKNIPADQVYLLVGDFNSRPPYRGVSENDETTIHAILEFGLKPAIDEEVYQTDPREFYTFNSESPVEKIDYIFYNPEKIEKIKAYVVKQMGSLSDHLPLYMKFIFKNQGE